MAKFCPSCGKEVDEKAVVCVNCGAAIKDKPTTSTATAGSDAKSKLVAGLLGIFLGCFGVHNFYLGYTKKAVTQLVLTIVGLILSIVIVGIFLVIAMEIWGLVEGIYILTGKTNVDAKGNALTD